MSLVLSPFAASTLAAVISVIGCAQKSPRTVPGPEAQDLVARSHGTIVVDHPVGGIETIGLPMLDSNLRRKPDSGLQSAHAVGGPDAQGRIVFIENHMTEKRHAVKWMGTDGVEHTIFEAPGDALWENAAGKYIATDLHGVHIAFVARAKDVGLKAGPDDPGVMLEEGDLEIWNVEKKERTAARATALDDQLAWFPDGKQLAYAALIPSGEAEGLLNAQVKPDDGFGRKNLGWGRVPAVKVLDMASGESRVLHVGERPVVSPDGKILLVRDSELHWRLVDLETKVSKACMAPGAIFPGAIAFVDQNTVLYWAWPTEGTETKYTKNNSPLAGRKQMRALKLVDLRDGRFQTAVPFIDPRLAVSFGAWTASMK